MVKETIEKYILIRALPETIVLVGAIISVQLFLEISPITAWLFTIAGIIALIGLYPPVGTHEYYGILVYAGFGVVLILLCAVAIIWDLLLVGTLALVAGIGSIGYLAYRWNAFEG